MRRAGNLKKLHLLTLYKSGTHGLLKSRLVQELFYLVYLLPDKMELLINSNVYDRSWKGTLHMSEEQSKD